VNEAAAGAQAPDLPSRAQVALRERSLVDVLDLTVRFCAAHARAYAKMSLVVLIPGLVASTAVARAGGWWLGWTTAMALAAFADAPFVSLASRLVFADEVRTLEALRAVRVALPALVGARLAQVLALVASAALAGLPWLWLGPRLFFVVEAIVLERAGVRAALTRAARIAGARFGAALGAMALLLLARVAATVLGDAGGREVLSQVLQIDPPKALLDVGGSWLALAGFWVGVPLAATARFFVYLDVRTRTEGWDIQTRFAALAAGARP
jgi:hypothetical protein